MEGLRKIAESAGISRLGICSAERFEEVEKLLVSAKAKQQLPPFTTDDIELRVNPQMTLPNAEMFIVVLSPYTPDIYQPRKGLYGNIAPSACGIDYHKIVMMQLKQICESLRLGFPDNIFMPFVDTSPFSEKHLAVRANLGQILHNGLFYSDTYGSRCFIGLILTDLKQTELQSEPSRSQCHIDHTNRTVKIDPSRCTKCKKCETMCPGGAITSDGFDSYKCVSWLTQKKEQLSEKEQIAIGRQIYGCDVCQRVCPQNPTIPAGFETGQEVSLEDIISLTGSRFKKTYKLTAAGWRGKNLLIRNAKIALQNISVDNNIEYKGE